MSLLTRALDPAGYSNCLAALRSEQSQICSRTERKYTSLHPAVERDLAMYILRSPDFGEGLNKGILLTGGTGIGKTVLVQSLCNVLSSAHGFPCRTLDMMSVQKAYRRGAADMTEVENIVERSPLLMLDDISEENSEAKTFGNSVNIGYELLSTRHSLWVSKGFLTFATSNADVKRIEEKYGPRIGSRLQEMFNIISLGGKDMRREG